MPEASKKLAQCVSTWVHAEEVRIRESGGSGSVIKVEVFDEQGAAHTVWAGNDPPTELNYLILKTPKTAQNVASKSL